MLQQIAWKKEKQLDLLVHLHDAKSFEMSHYFQNSIRDIVILTDGNTEEFNVKFTAKNDVLIGYFMLPLLMLTSKV